MIDLYQFLRYLSIPAVYYLHPLLHEPYQCLHPIRPVPSPFHNKSFGKYTTLFQRSDKYLVFQVPPRPDLYDLIRHILCEAYSDLRYSNQICCSYNRLPFLLLRIRKSLSWQTDPVGIRIVL